MATTRCFIPFKAFRVRFTLLDSCGTPVNGTCSTISSDGIITVEQAATYEDREEFFVKNGDGKFCVQETNPPILKFITTTVTLCNVDPEIVTFVTGQRLLLDDASSPVAIGNAWRTNDAWSAYFAMELWTRVANPTDCTTPLYGYGLWPFLVEGTKGDVTYQNGNATFQFVARTKIGSNWGTGPYAVYKSAASATLGNPTALFTAVSADEHVRLTTTTLGPPDGACGCIALPDPALTFVDSGAHVGTLTLPTTPFTNVLPGVIDWGDSTTTTVAVGAGPTVPHTYAMAGTYTAVYRSSAFSASPWSSAATPIA